MSEHKSSINFKAVKTNSEIHNTRKTELNYIDKNLTKNNESFEIDTIQKKTFVNLKAIASCK